MKRKKILLVEDDFSTREGYAMAFYSEDFDVIQAQDGSEGLELALRNKPDLIVSDIMMPVMDGIDMLRSLREGNDYAKNVPVVMLTNLSADIAKIDEKVPNAGTVYYILKVDFTFRQLAKKIKEMLSQTK
jgi:DNA-binding response OmpR family regulator